MSFWQAQQQPGLHSENFENVREENGNDENVDNSNNIIAPTSPASRQKMKEKKDLRDLNYRLQMYVQTQSKHRQAVESLKETLAKQEMEFRNKIRDKESQFNQINEKLRNENESLQFQNKQLHEELQTFETTSCDLQQRAEGFQKRLSEKDSEIEGLKHQITLFSTELKTLRTENADLKYKYENHDNERKKLMQQFKQIKEKNNHLMKDLTKRQSENRSQCEAFNRLLSEKTSENDRLSEENRLLNQEKDSIQEKLRIEFDSKLKEFVSKREDQYKVEKDEWMRIFKQEFNRKLRNYKDANTELSNNNTKLEEEIVDLQARLSKLKHSKSDYELQIRSLEEEIEKMRNEFDTLRKMKDVEIKNKCQLIAELTEQQKQRDIEFDEVVGIKIQLAQEIELYRRILSEAEQNAGFGSPTTSNNRKKRRLNKNGSNVIAGARETLGFTTPGLARGAQIARKDLCKFDVSSKDGTDTEREIEEEDDNSNSQCNGDDIDTEPEPENDFVSDKNVNVNVNENENENDKNNEKIKLGRKRPRESMYIDDNEETYFEEKDSENYVTPGGGEPWPLQFSTMDLTRSMIEIQNISDAPVCLRGYTLSNSDGHAQFPLPSEKVLNVNEKLRVKIGLRAKADYGDENTILWKADVWTGDEDDVARLYDPNQCEIARIDITPDMLPNDKKHNGNCLVM